MLFVMAVILRQIYKIIAGDKLFHTMFQAHSSLGLSKAICLNYIKKRNNARFLTAWGACDIYMHYCNVLAYPRTIIWQLLLNLKKTPRKISFDAFSNS